MLEKVLQRIDNGDLVMYAVWEPILRTDHEAAAHKATVLLPDPRVQHFWAPTQAVGESFQKPIALTTEPAWDVYLAYPRGVLWSDDPPAHPPSPAFFMHQLAGRLPAEQLLDGARLATGLQAMLDAR